MTIKKTDDWTYIVEDDDGHLLAHIVDNGAANEIDIAADPTLPIYVTCCDGIQDVQLEIRKAPHHDRDVLNIRTLYDSVEFNWHSLI